MGLFSLKAADREPHFSQQRRTIDLVVQGLRIAPLERTRDRLEPGERALHVVGAVDAQPMVVLGHTGSGGRYRVETPPEIEIGLGEAS